MSLDKSLVQFRCLRAKRLLLLLVFLFTACYHNRISSIMDRFLKRTEHPVSPVLPAPKKPKVSSKQGVISASF